jgi:hypothetical protein
MKLKAAVALLLCAAVLASCAATPMTDAERAAQARAEEERRIKVDNTGH